MCAITEIYNKLREQYKDNLSAIPMTFCEDSMEHIPTKVWEYKQSLK